MGNRGSEHPIDGRDQRPLVFMPCEVQHRVRFQEVFGDSPVPAHIDRGVWFIAAVRLESDRDRIRPGGVDKVGQRSDAAVGVTVGNNLFTDGNPLEEAPSVTHSGDAEPLPEGSLLASHSEKPPDL